MCHTLQQNTCSLPALHHSGHPHNFPASFPTASPTLLASHTSVQHLQFTCTTVDIDHHNVPASFLTASLALPVNVSHTSIQHLQFTCIHHTTVDIIIMFLLHSLQFLQLCLYHTRQYNTCSSPCIHHATVDIIMFLLHSLQLL